MLFFRNPQCLTLTARGFLAFSGPFVPEYDSLCYIWGVGVASHVILAVEFGNIIQTPLWQAEEVMVQVFRANKRVQLICSLVSTEG